VNAKQENKRGVNVFPGRFHLLSIIMQGKSHGFPLVSREMIYTWWVNSRKIFVYDRGYGLIPMTSRFLRAYLGFRPESAPADAPLLRLEPAASRFPNIYGFIPMAGYGQHWSYDLDLLPSGYLT
jgi:hypothetical protein